MQNNKLHNDNYDNINSNNFNCNNITQGATIDTSYSTTCNDTAIECIDFNKNASISFEPI